MKLFWSKELWCLVFRTKNFDLELGALKPRKSWHLIFPYFIKKGERVTR